MLFPYGEWVILFLTLEAWVEKRASQRFFLSLSMTWLIGKWLELMVPVTIPWHWHFARLSVMLFFWGWALKRAEKRMFPLLVTSLIVGMETLFQVNEPGVLPYGPWIFLLIIVLVAWLTGKTFWGTAAALSGSLLINQAFVRFTYDGIVSYADLPEELVWNFGVCFFALWASLCLARQYYTERNLEKVTAHKLSSNNGVSCEPLEERELQ